MPLDILLESTSLIADFYDGCKYGCQGCEGYRKSTDLRKFIACITDLTERGFVKPEKTVFLDLGCADGRVNVLMSYFVRSSLGIEIDPEILSEYAPRKEEVAARLRAHRLMEPPGNIATFHGSSVEGSTYRRILAETGYGFVDVDLFYTYITLHDLFGEKIAREARPGALYLVYGFNKVLPRYTGLELLISDVASQGIVALYGKR